MMKTLKTARIAVIALLLCSLSAKAQQKYQTREGIIEVIGSYGDSIISANSNHLFVLIDYETAEIGLTIDPASLHTATDSLNAILTNTSLKPIILSGKLNIPYVTTLQHPDQKLNFTAQLEMNKMVNNIYADGILKHVAGSDALSSLLTLNFKLRLSDFGIFLPEAWGDEINVRIYQAMLKKQ